ncbi:hypothetical protein ARAM_002770 [Aspergillus rambellii]|uniref:Prefoldin subunit 6 n=2 Tax=Aspergillus subgen. Nidulantes TaxID=2720870 RepID=A0A0F8U9G1_9EURO|nr:hypothetical protein ARAM_002770 [Aspergillus rambellii]KKK19314.1 hypothetical protein AOCH_003842 [Aspergillus ochraceoroseus]
MADPQKQLQALSDEFQALQTGMFVIAPAQEERTSRSQPLLIIRPSETNSQSSITELDGLVEARQKLESQQQENKSVQKEFTSLDDDANIYKLVGPVLLKQDKSEAMMSVNGRLEFIEKEVQRIEGQIQENQDKSDKKRTEIVQFQSQVQQAAAASA